MGIQKDSTVKTPAKLESGQAVKFLFHGNGKDLRYMAGGVEKLMKAPRRRFTVYGELTVVKKARIGKSTYQLAVGIAYLNGKLDKQYIKAIGTEIAMKRAQKRPIVTQFKTKDNAIALGRATFNDFIRGLYSARRHSRSTKKWVDEVIKTI